MDALVILIVTCKSRPIYELQLLYIYTVHFGWEGFQPVLWGKGKTSLKGTRSQASGLADREWARAVDIERSVQAVDPDS